MPIAWHPKRCGGIETLWNKLCFLSNFFDQNVSKYLKPFSIKNYTWRVDMVQNLYKFWAQNVSITLDQTMS